MFDLEREVDRWTDKAFAGSCRGKAASLAELRDHLHSDVERLMGEGRSSEDAFRMATARLGETAGGLAAPEGNSKLRQARLANAMIWAALILGTALVLAKRSDQDVLNFLLIGVLLPLWFAADQLLARLLRAPGER